MKVSTLDTQNPAYNEEELDRFEALYSGGDDWRNLVNYWIPQHPEESDTIYQKRLMRALYENHAGPIVDMIVGAMFSQPPTVEDVEGDWLADFVANVDGRGTGLAVWFSALVRSALVGQRAFAWVNLPARTGPAVDNRADEEKLGLLDAYLVPLDACSVIDWGTDSVGRLAWVMVRDTYSERKSVDSERETIWRWTYIDPVQIRRWEWRPKPGQESPQPDDDAPEILSIPHGMKAMPVVDLCLPDGLHAMGKVHDPAVAHIRGRNDLSWALHRGAHPLLWMKDKDRGDEGDPVLGPGRYMRIYEEWAEVGYAEPSGASFALLAEDVVQLREAIYRVVHQMAVGADSNATRAKMSGESKAQDWQALETVLAALADVVRPMISRTVAMVAMARGVPDAQPEVNGLDGWEQEDLTTWLANAALATDAHQLSATYRKEVAKRQARSVLSETPEEVLAVIEKEIDEADPILDVMMTPLPPEVPGAPSGSTTPRAGD